MCRLRSVDSSARAKVLLPEAGSPVSQMVQPVVRQQSVSIAVAKRSGEGEEAVIEGVVTETRSS